MSARSARLVALVLVASACESGGLTPGGGASDEEIIERRVEASLTQGATVIAPATTVGDPNDLALSTWRVDGGHVAQVSGSLGVFALIKDDGTVTPFGARRKGAGGPLAGSRVLRAGSKAIVLECDGSVATRHDVDAASGTVEEAATGVCDAQFAGVIFGAGAGNHVVGARREESSIVVRAYSVNGTALVPGETLLSYTPADDLGSFQPEFVEETSPGVIELVGRRPGGPGAYDLVFLGSGGVPKHAGATLPLQFFDAPGARGPARWFGPGRLRLAFEFGGAGALYAWDVASGAAFAQLDTSPADASLALRVFGFGEAVGAATEPNPLLPENTTERVPVRFTARAGAIDGYLRADTATTPCTSREACRALGETDLLGVVGLASRPVAIYRLWAWAGASQRVVGVYATPLRPPSADAGESGGPGGAGGTGGAGGAAGTAGAAGKGGGSAGASGGAAGQAGASGSAGQPAGSGGEQAGGAGGGSGSATCASGALFEESKVLITSGSFSMEVRTILSGDFDRDGHADLLAVLAASTSSDTALLLGKGDLTFGPSTTAEAGSSPFVAVGDMNGDGYADVAGQNGPLAAGAELYWGLGGPAGALGSWVQASLASLPGRQRGIASADLDGDGLADAAFVHDAGARLAVVLSRPKFEFILAADVAVTGGLLGSLFARDLDGDGKADLVGVDSAGSVQVFLAPFTGAALVGPASPGAGAVAVATLDGDLSPDLAVAHAATKAISILAGDGKAGFVETAVLPLPHAPGSLVAGDLDGNGTLDLVSADVDAGTLVVLLGKGDGTFAPPTTFETASPPSALFAVDLDGDGRAEIAYATPVAYGGGKWVSLLKLCP